MLQVGSVSMVLVSMPGHDSITSCEVVELRTISQNLIADDSSTTHKSMKQEENSISEISLVSSDEQQLWDILRSSLHDLRTHQIHFSHFLKMDDKSVACG